MPSHTRRRAARRLVLVLGSALIWPAPAAAYIDPGAGSLVVQGIIAGLIGAGLAIKVFWRRIGDALGLRRRRDDDDADA
jgi:hypothetical protein